ncbi:glycine zipper domain-containing protein [Oricola sp.]|uniref:glycine zipper domain-containing protein n=1 Tax=Oricola sp. TaxID=1979950 RepID=UPI0025F217B0|nr:glycine zipper domain-containing protein [Oricola sp.]MCI5075143.1 glycine zipper domain-containing protein [Oricola sp.]
MKITKTIAVLAVVGALAGCTTAEQSATVGAAAGGAIGAAVTGDLGGAAIGAFIGGVGGYLLGKEADGRCRYRRPNGQIFYAACP